jgi:hypothetical protein
LFPLFDNSVTERSADLLHREAAFLVKLQVLNKTNENYFNWFMCFRLSTGLISKTAATIRLSPATDISCWVWNGEYQCWNISVGCGTDLSLKAIIKGIRIAIGTVNEDRINSLVKRKV